MECDELTEPKNVPQDFNDDDLGDDFDDDIEDAPGCPEGDKLNCRKL